ncbi:MAG: sugar transferase [Bacteroidota bacterium]
MGKKKSQQDYWGLKRGLDCLLAASVLIFSWPFATVVFLINLVAFSGKPFFKQKRIGFQEQTFSLWKFRSMRVLHRASGEPLPDGERLTVWGTWLRKTHLDEWPQLFHILRGQMSWVGPRPLLPDYLPHYTPEERARHQVLPGLAGLAQAKGGNALPWDQRLQWDVRYAEAPSFALDLKLLIFTLNNLRTSAHNPVFSDRLDHHRIGEA